MRVPSGRRPTLGALLVILTVACSPFSLFAGEVPTVAYGDKDATCEPSPTALDFGYVTRFEYRDRWLTIENNGTSPLVLDPVIQPSVFQVVDYPASIAPGESGVATIRFSPGWGTTGVAGTLDLIYYGNCPTVYLSGRGESSWYDCEVQPVTLDFGDVLLGQSATRTISVTNTGSSGLFLNPQAVDPAFRFTGGLWSLPPDRTATFLVTFTPREPGPVLSEAFMGSVCENVYLEGNGVRGFAPDENLVGIYFDASYRESETVTETAYKKVRCYAVMHNPSESSGVGAWEFAFKLTGEAQLLDWDLAGDYVNVGYGREFIVGIGNQPLLPDRDGNVLLGSFDFMVAKPYPSEVTVRLEPIGIPSLPGLMAWIPWDDAEMILPLLPVTGDWTLGWVNSDPTPVRDIPAPLAQLDDDLVTLEWPVPAGLADGAGFHVYRRVDGAAAVRLTEAPLEPATDRLVYGDRVFGLALGTVLYYSYALVEDGAETLRSPETEVRLAGLPVLRTKLLANVPNPFNPSTEVRFQLQRPGRVRVAVYDMTGRLVRDLADEDLAAGPHHRVWDGRDRGGRPVPSGAYYLRLETPDATDHRKVMLLK